MSIKRITLSVPERVAVRLKKAAGNTPVSAWVTDLIEERLDDAELEQAWNAFLRDVAPSGRDVQRADALFKRLVATPRKRKVA